MAVFSDDFNRANSSDVGANWLEVSGDWSISGSQLSPGSAGGTIILRAAAVMDSSDHYAQVTITATTAASHGLWCRGNGSGGLTSGYLLRNDGSSWDLFWIVGGSFNVIGSYAAPAVAGDVVRLQAVGSTIKGIINGTERIVVTDTAVPTGTSAGLRSESSAAIRFDDFAAADITAGAVLTPAAASEAAQTLTGAKTGTLGVSASTQAVQALTGGKAGAVAPSVETAGVQALAGTKTAQLGAVTVTDSGQPLSVATGQALAPAATVTAVQPMTGAKRATLGAAVVAVTARPVSPASADTDIDVIVGPPHGSSCTTGPPHTSGWAVGAPC